MLADAGQHLIEHPALKTFRRGQLAVDDEAVHVAFGDKSHLNGFPEFCGWGTSRFVTYRQCLEIEARE